MELNWDDLSIENKRDFQILLANSQNSLNLTAGGLHEIPINLGTFDKVNTNLYITLRTDSLIMNILSTSTDYAQIIQLCYRALHI